MSLPRRDDRRVLRAAMMLLGLLAIALVEVRAALELAPAALLAATLYLGYRPGEKLIERIAERRRRRLAKRPARIFNLCLESGRVAVLIRRLLAIDLAMRPPPASMTF